MFVYWKKITFGIVLHAICALRADKARSTNFVLRSVKKYRNDHSLLPQP